MKPNGFTQTEIISGNAEDQKSSSREITMTELSRMVFSTEKNVDCLFFKVPELIRRVRRECYEPQLIALGLYGRGNTQCSMMESVKLELASVVLKVLLNSTDVAKTEVHSGVSGEIEKVTAMWNHLCDQLVPPGNEGIGIWKQYSDAPQNLTFPKVQHYLVLDAMFLVSFMLFQHADPKTGSSGIVGFRKYDLLLQIFTRAEILCNINAMNSDIWLFENQIPLILISRMVREMYLDEEGKKSRSSEQKNVAAEQVVEILIRKTFQKALRVLPGNYRTRSGSKTESRTDRMLKSRTLSKRTHLLECLYKLVCSWDYRVDKEETAVGKPPNHVDNLDEAHRGTEEEGGFSDQKRSDRRSRWSKTRSPAISFEGSKGKSQEDMLSPFRSSQSEIVNTVIDEESEFRQTTGEKYQKELGSDDEPADVEDLLCPPPFQEFKGAAEQMVSFSASCLANSSALQMEQDQQRARERRASGPQSRSFSKTEPRPSSKQLSTAGSPAAQASEREEQPRFCCLHNSRVTSMCCGETPIHLDSYILPTVTVLREVGIGVRSDTSPGCHCKVELTYSCLPWGNATLHISPLHVDGIVETLLRNLLVHETVSSDNNKLITYLQCLDDLIDTASDVSLLKQGRHPVILNSSGDERDVATLFNKLLEGSKLYYNPQLEAIRRNVRSYYLQQWRHLLTEMKERYWNHKKPWLAISLVAAFWLLLFTGIQTVYTVLGFYK